MSNEPSALIEQQDDSTPEYYDDEDSEAVDEDLGDVIAAEMDDVDEGLSAEESGDPDQPSDDSDEDDSNIALAPSADDEIEDSDSTNNVAELVQQVKLPLTFEVGDAQISVGRLQSLLPGYTFELSTPIEKPVLIKAHGQVVGRGQLVQVGERLGVRLMEMTPHGD